MKMADDTSSAFFAQKMLPRPLQRMKYNILFFAVVSGLLPLNNKMY